MSLRAKLEYSRPHIVCSMCLGFRPVRYDGNILFDDRVEKLKRYAEFISVCPETGIGLGVPRNPLVLYRGNSDLKLIDTVTSRDLTSDMMKFAISFLTSLQRVDGFILKAGSPSCGVMDAKVYGEGRRVRGKTNGLFTRFVRQSFPLIPVESEKRLENYDLRRDFYTRVFTIAYVRDALGRAKSREDIVALHRGLKYLLMLYSPRMLRQLGRIVARRKEFDFGELREVYEKGVLSALSRKPTAGSYVSVFEHLYGHIKNDLPSGERRYVVELIEKYYTGRESLRTVLGYFKGFIYRFDNPYLAEQRFLQPYPEELDEPS